VINAIFESEKQISGPIPIGIAEWSTMERCAQSLTDAAASDELDSTALGRRQELDSMGGRTMGVEENKLVVREFIEETLNKGNVELRETMLPTVWLSSCRFLARDRAWRGSRTFFEGCILPSRICTGRSRSKLPKRTRCLHASPGPEPIRPSF